MDFKLKLAELIKDNTNLELKEISNIISVPPNPKMGDYSFPCFKLKIKGNPKEKAELLGGKIKQNLPSFITKIQSEGPYLNFFLNKKVMSETVLTEIYKQAKSYGKQNVGKNKTIVMDFSAPNIAKPFGIGHLRSTVIGNCIYKILENLGYKPIGINHLGDWGTQFGKLIVAFKKWGNEEELKKDPIKFLLKIYVKFHDEAEKDDNLIEEARTAFKNLEDGDKDLTKLWEQFRELSLKEFEKVYELMNIKFDYYQGEAFYNKVLDQTIEEVKTKTKTEISDGALIVDLEKYNMPPLLLRKSNGGTTYHTRDLAAAFYRFKKYKADKLLYVVGSEQNLHFEQLFKTLELMGYDKNKFVHINFGLFKFPDGKMSTRKGKVIFLDDVLKKSIDLVEQIIKEKNPNLKDKEKVAKQVGIGAIIFFDLSNDRIRNIDFKWDRILAFDGETAPYLQYTHAITESLYESKFIFLGNIHPDMQMSIIKKANSERGIRVINHINFESFETEKELELIKELNNYPEILRNVAKTFKPHHLANYLISVGQKFNEFYHSCPVLSDDVNKTKARLLLVDCTRQIISNGLGMMGIESPQEM